MSARRILPWALLIAVFIVGFGPFTNSIYRTAPGVASSPAVLDVAVSPTAAATVVDPASTSRYGYRYIAVGTNSAFGCCMYGVGQGTPAATPSVSGTACGAGFFVLPNQYITESQSPQQSLNCITSVGTLTFSIENNN